MKTKFLSSALVAILLSVSSIASAGLIYDIQNSKLMGVNGIELNGEVYNVQFGHSCETMYNGCDANMFTFNTSVDAVAALSALYSQAIKDDVIVEGVEYDFDTITTLMFSIETTGFAEIWVPFAQSGSDATSAWGSHGGGINDWNLADANAVWSTGYGFGDSRGAGDREYMAFTKWDKVAVPEPSTLAIFALGIIGLASRRFKKQS